MGLFDSFKKKKKPEYDPANVRVTDLDKKFILEYDMKSWEVKEAYEYDWGSHFFTKEFKIFDGNENLYLSVENEDDLYLTMSKKVRIRKIDEDLPEYIIEHGQPPKKIQYNNEKYLLDKESPGYMKNSGSSNKKDDEEWVEFISWDYYNDDETHCISIEQWEEKEFEASVGKIIKESEISNILPSE